MNRPNMREIVSRLRRIVIEIRALNPDKNWLMQNYWIDQNTFPAQARAIRPIVAEIVALNPAYLIDSEVSQRVILTMIQSVWGEPFRENEFDEEMFSTVNGLVTYQGSQEIHMQLQNLIALEPFAFAGVSIVPIPNFGDTTEYNRKYAEGSFRSDDPTAVNAFALVRQAPGLGTAAWYNAASETERVLRLIRGIGLPTLWGREWGQMSITGRIVGSGFTIMRTRPGAWNSSMRTRITPATWYMRLDDMLRNYGPDKVRRLEAIYVNQHRSKIENKVLQAISWLGDATFPAEAASKFAHLAIAFETAVGGEASGDDTLKEIGLTQMLAERVAFLLGSSETTRLAWHKFVVRLYKSRSRVMHGEAEPVTNPELTQWAHLVWSSVRAMLDLTSRFRTVEQFTNWVRNSRYSLP